MSFLGKKFKLTSVSRGFCFFNSLIGPRIFVSFIIILMAAGLEGFGLMMFLPLIEGLGKVSEAYSNPSNSLGWFKYYVSANALTLKKLLNIDLTLAFLIVIASIFVGKGILSFLAQAFNANLKGEISLKIRKKILYSSVNKPDLGRFDASLITEQSNRCVQAFHAFSLTGAQVILCVIYLLVGFWIDPLFAVISLVFGIITLLLYRQLNSAVQGQSRTVGKMANLMASQTIQLAESREYLLATGQVRIITSAVTRSFEQFSKSAKFMWLASAFSQTAREPIAVLMVASLIFAQTFVSERELWGMLVSILVFYRCVGAILALQSWFQNFMENVGAIELVDAAVFEDSNSTRGHSEISGSKVEKDRLELGSCRDQLTLEVIDLSIQHQNSIDPFPAVSFNARVGQCVIVRGKSGSGKTTLIKCIMGLQNHSGTINLKVIGDSSVAKKLSPSDIGYVQQQPLIFQGTALQNISMVFDRTLKVDELSKARDALNTVGLGEAFLVRENGEQAAFNSVAVGGGGLSGGQAQRLAIAREIYRSPVVYFFDEPTSALDPRSANQIFEIIGKLKRNSIVILVTHSEPDGDLADLIVDLAGTPISKSVV